MGAEAVGQKMRNFEYGHDHKTLRFLQFCMLELSVKKRQAMCTWTCILQVGKCTKKQNS